MPFDFAQDAGVDHRRLHILVTGQFLHGADTEPETAEELRKAENLECMRLLRGQTGWGIIELTFKGGQLDEAITSISKKPKLNNN